MRTSDNPNLDDNQDLFEQYDEAHPTDPHVGFERDKDKLASETDATLGAEELEAMRAMEGQRAALDEDSSLDTLGDSPTETGEPEADMALQTELERATSELDRYQRALAEAQNSRRRAEERARADVQRANEEFLTSLLPVVDAFARARGAAEGDNVSVDALREGLALIDRQLQTFLGNAGVEIVEVSVGDAFDETIHEAMMRQPAADVPEGHVAAVFEQGVRLNGRVVRHARVAVAAPTVDAQA